MKYGNMFLCRHSATHFICFELDWVGTIKRRPIKYAVQNSGVFRQESHTNENNLTDNACKYL